MGFLRVCCLGFFVCLFFLSLLHLGFLGRGFCWGFCVCVCLFVLGEGLGFLFLFFYFSLVQPFVPIYNTPRAAEFVTAQNEGHIFILTFGILWLVFLQ